MNQAREWGWLGDLLPQLTGKKERLVLPSQSRLVDDWVSSIYWEKMVVKVALMAD